MERKPPPTIDPRDHRLYGHDTVTTTARLQEQFGYVYDAAWNLNRRTNNALVQTFGVNNRSELSPLPRGAGRSRTAIHGMIGINPASGQPQTPEQALRNNQAFMNQQLLRAVFASDVHARNEALGHGLHAVQDRFADGHGNRKIWDGGGIGGFPSLPHLFNDFFPSKTRKDLALRASVDFLNQYKASKAGLDLMDALLRQILPPGAQTDCE